MLHLILYASAFNSKVTARTLLCVHCLRTTPSLGAYNYFAQVCVTHGSDGRTQRTVINRVIVHMSRDSDIELARDHLDRYFYLERVKESILHILCMCWVRFVRYPDTSARSRDFHHRHRTDHFPRCQDSCAPCTCKSFSSLPNSVIHEPHSRIFAPHVPHSYGSQYRQDPRIVTIAVPDECACQAVPRTMRYYQRLEKGMVFGSRPQEGGSSWTAIPFVQVCNIPVSTQIGKIQVHHPRGVSTVNEYLDPACMTRLCQLSHRKHQGRIAGDVIKNSKSCSRANGLLHCFHNLIAGCDRHWDVDSDMADTTRLAPNVKHLTHGRVPDRQGQHLVSFCPFSSRGINHGIEPHCRSGNKDKVRCSSPYLGCKLSHDVDQQGQ
eukprot:m.34111 g.34111  ORF g.34111 m.34111 type:complete len:379 (-) comp5103_c0_seq1:580-1716(-)